MFFLVGGIFAAIFLVFFLSFFVSSSVLFLSSPLYDFKNTIFQKTGEFSAVFKEKSELLKENRDLRQLLDEKYILEQEMSILRRENEEFRNVLSRSKKNEYILASVASVNSFDGLNTLIVDAGKKQGVKEKMVVTAFGNVYLGYVDEVVSNSSKIKLVSLPGMKTDVFIGGFVSSVAHGRGGENMEIVLPADIDIKLKEVISTLGNKPLVVGVVDRIIKEPLDPFQKVLFRLPLNINELRHVYIIKN